MNGREILSFTAILLLSIAFFLSVSTIWVGAYDEGVILTGAFRVLNGDVPSKDFYANYGPAQFYILSALFEAFGATILVARIYDAAVLGLIVAFLFYFIRRLCSAQYAILSLLTVAAFLIEFGLPLYPVTLGILICMTAATALSRGLVEADTSWVYLRVSLAVAFLLLLRYDLATFAISALGLPMVIVQAMKAWDGEMDVRQALAKCLFAALILVAAPLGALVLLAYSGMLAPAMHDLVKFNGVNFVEMRSLPFHGSGQVWRDPLELVALYLPIGASLMGLLTLALFGRTRRARDPIYADRRMVSIVVFTSLTFCFFWKGWLRPSGEQMLFANVPAIVLVYLCTPRLLSFDRSHSRIVTARGAKIAGLGIVSSLFAVVLLQNWQSRPVYRHLEDLGDEGQVPALGIFRTHPDRMEAARYILRNSDPGERIFSATGRHDKVFVNDVLIYFMTSRMPASRWHHYDPGVQTTEEVQREIIRELDEIGRPLLIRVSTWDGVKEPNRSSESSGVFLLDEYLKRSYRQEVHFGEISIHRSLAGGES